MKEESLKISTLYTTLIRKGLVTEDGKLTTVGSELLSFIRTKTRTRLPKLKVDNPDFDEWWKTYPGTDTFTQNGRVFTGNRALRTGKDDCRAKFSKILLEGEYTAKQLIEALKYDVNQKKQASFTARTNKLSFMQNSLTYLNQRSFEPFIELINTGIQTEETNIGTTDI